MTENLIMLWIYKAILLFFIAIFMRNLFEKNAKLSSQIMNALVIVPFVLRLLSIR
jgi:hypothetical protein